MVSTKTLLLKHDYRRQGLRCLEWAMFGNPNLGAKKSTQTFFVQSFSRTLRVMDVRAENRGRPHQKVRFPAAPVVGRNFLTPGHSGVRVKNVRGKSGPKSLCLCCFSSLKLGHPQTCVYPDVCLGIAHVSGKGPLPGQGVWQLHNVSALFALQIPWRKGQIHCVSARPLVPGEGLYQIHGQSLNTHRGKHRSGGAR